LGETRLRRGDYERLASWRFALRRFLRFSQMATRDAGLSRSQHTLLLFVKVFPGERPSVSDLAERLQVRHHSAVGLIDRCERAGFLRREKDSRDRRRVRVRLTRRAETLLNKLSLEHLKELATLREAFPIQRRSARKGPGRRRVAAAGTAARRRKPPR
jgi:DNA-binding MarR family transcriptional regulator